MFWYVARTKRQKELQVATILDRCGVEVYLPFLRNRRHCSGRNGSELMFPCYLFAKLEIPSEKWMIARSAPGISYFLGSHNECSALSDEFMTELIARVESANSCSAGTRFCLGERVVIAYGPFEYLEALFDRRLSPSGRSRVLVEILGRLVPITLPEEYLLSSRQ